MMLSLSSILFQPETVLILGTAVVVFLVCRFAWRLRDERIQLWGGRSADPAVVQREQRINQIESDLGLRLPPNYRAYMRDPGLGANDRLIGSDWDLGVIIELQSEARELLAENEEVFQLRNEDFVCMMHQGYMFQFFPCDQGDDPPVYEYVEGVTAEPRRTHESLSDWLPDILHA